MNEEKRAAWTDVVLDTDLALDEDCWSCMYAKIKFATPVNVLYCGDSGRAERIVPYPDIGCNSWKKHE